MNNCFRPVPKILGRAVRFVRPDRRSLVRPLNARHFYHALSKELTQGDHSHVHFHTRFKNFSTVSTFLSTHSQLLFFSTFAACTSRTALRARGVRGRKRRSVFFCFSPFCAYVDRTPAQPSEKMKYFCFPSCVYH